MVTVYRCSPQRGVLSYSVITHFSMALMKCEKFGFSQAIAGCYNKYYSGHFSGPKHVKSNYY